MNDANLKILSRIKKMLALAADSAATEGERDNALRMAHATMAKYAISEAQVSVTDTDHDPRTHKILDLSQEVADWQLRVATGISNLLFCRNYRDRINSHIVFIGKSVNTQTAVYMTEYVLTSITKESEKATKEYFGGFKLDSLLGIDSGETPEATKRVWRESFCIGAAQVVYKRCDAMIAESKTTDVHGTGTALVLLSLYQREVEANSRYISEVLNISLTATRSTVAMAQGAAATGAAFGGRINLSRQIGSGSSQLRIGKK